MEIPMEEFPQPINVFSFFPEFHEVNSFAVLRTPWNNEKNSWSSSVAGLLFLCSNTRLLLFCFAPNASLTWLTHHSWRFIHFTGARRSPSMSFPKRMRLAKATDSEMDALYVWPQSRATPVMIEEEERQTVLSQSFSPLYQCSSRTSKSTGREKLSTLSILTCLDDREGGGRMPVNMEPGSLTKGTPLKSPLFGLNL